VGRCPVAAAGILQSERSCREGNARGVLALMVGLIEEELPAAGTLAEAGDPWAPQRLVVER